MQIRKVLEKSEPSTVPTPTATKLSKNCLLQTVMRRETDGRQGLKEVVSSLESKKKNKDRVNQLANFLPDQINGSNREATKQMISLSQLLIKLKTLHRQRKRVRKEGQRWCETGITLCLRVHWRYYHENNYTACILPPALLRLFSVFGWKFW